MFAVTSYAGLVPYAAALLAHLAGLVVAIILLVRAKRTPAILAVVGFALLVLINLAQLILRLPPVVRSLAFGNPAWTWFLNCCCSVFDAGAIACLIVAIWQALSAAGVGEVVAGGDEEVAGGDEEMAPMVEAVTVITPEEMAEGSE
jgi:hypothetical protein